MSDAVIIALIASIPAILAAISSMLNGRQMGEIKGMVNGMGDKRNEATQKSAFAEGQKETLAAVAAGKSAPSGAENNPP